MQIATYAKMFYKLTEIYCAAVICEMFRLTDYLHNYTKKSTQSQSSELQSDSLESDNPTSVIEIVC